MKTALELIQELADERNKKDWAANEASVKAANDALKKQMDFWSPLSRIVWEVSEKYSDRVRAVNFWPRQDPFFKVSIIVGQFEDIYFKVNNGQVSLQWRNKTLGTSDKVEDLIPALIDKLADVVRVDSKKLM
jgi:hypothetical protein